MSIRAKFLVHSVSRDLYKNENVVAHSVTDPANKGWCTSTPAGKLELSISNPDAQGFMQPGKCYMLTVEEAPAKEADEK